MPITQRLMKPGSFSLRLIPGCPFSAAGAIARFDHIVITPTPLDPIEGFSDADILGKAIYTGVIRKMPDPRTLQGADLSAWLGTEDGIGNNFGATLELTQTMSAWVSSILTAAGNGITAGTLTNTGLSSLTGAPSWCSPREAIDWVMRGTGAEYRIRPTGTLDAAKAPDLFVSTPTTVVTRYEECQDGPYRGLEGELISTAADVEQYTTEVQVIGTGQGVSVVVETATGSTTFKTFTNTTPVFRRFVNAPSEVAAAAAVASMQLGLWNQERTEVTLTSRTYNVSRIVAAGDYVWVYDQAAGLVDPANQISYRGDVITPIKMRVHALTWPVHSGLGVYLRKSGATPTYIDLTPYVGWENGEVQWDVGAAPRASNDVDAKLAGSTAYLGANAAVAERAAEAPASRCEARPPGTQVLTSGVGAAVELTAENTDTGGFHDNSTNNTRLTAPYSGVYFVSYTMDIAAQAGGDRSFWFAKNGGSVRYAATNAIGTTARHEMCGSCDIELDAGDYVELIAYQSSGVSLFTGTQSWCAVQIRYVSAV